MGCCVQPPGFLGRSKKIGQRTKVTVSERAGGVWKEFIYVT